MRKALALLVLLALVGIGGFAATSTDAGGGPPFHCNMVNMHPNSLPNGQEGVAYGPGNTLWLTPNSMALPVMVCSVTGALQCGLSLVVTGPNTVALQGTPCTGSAGVYTFTIELCATYILGTICKASKTYTITIAP